VQGFGAITSQLSVKEKLEHSLRRTEVQKNQRSAPFRSTGGTKKQTGAEYALMSKREMFPRRIETVLYAEWATKVNSADPTRKKAHLDGGRQILDLRRGGPRDLGRADNAPQKRANQGNAFRAESTKVERRQ